MLKAFVPKAKAGAENLAPWSVTPAEAFAGWVESPAHYENLTNPRYTHIGVAVVEGANGGYWSVQQFAQIP
jgi:uncharacterized protein YkwD